MYQSYRRSIPIKANDVRNITSLVRHILYLVFFWFAVWSCIAWSVVNGHTILTYTRSSEFFFCVFRLICEFCILFAIFPTVAYRTYMYVPREVAGEVSLTPGAVISGYFP